MILARLCHQRRSPPSKGGEIRGAAGEGGVTKLKTVLNSPHQHQRGAEGADGSEDVPASKGA